FARTSNHTSTEYATSGSRGSWRFQLPHHAARMSRAASLSASACHLAFSASLMSSVIGPPRAWRRYQATPDEGATAPLRGCGRSWVRHRLRHSERDSAAEVARPPRGWRAPGPGLRLAGLGPSRLAPARVPRHLELCGRRSHTTRRTRVAPAPPRRGRSYYPGHPSSVTPSLSYSMIPKP